MVGEMTPGAALGEALECSQKSFSLLAPGGWDEGYAKPKAKPKAKANVIPGMAPKVIRPFQVKMSLGQAKSSAKAKALASKCGESKREQAKPEAKPKAEPKAEPKEEPKEEVVLPPEAFPSLSHYSLSFEAPQDDRPTISLVVVGHVDAGCSRLASSVAFALRSSKLCFSKEDIACVACKAERHILVASSMKLMDWPLSLAEKQSRAFDLYQREAQNGKNGATFLLRWWRWKLLCRLPKKSYESFRRRRHRSRASSLRSGNSLDEKQFIATIKMA